MNREDYKRTQKFNVEQVRYIHGIGINTARLTPGKKQNDIRLELGLNKDDFIVLSVGELNENKNQKVIIEALSVLNDKKIHYLLCGKGNQADALKKLVAERHLEKNVHFLGYRKDVVDICSQSDVYVMPSKREGLPVVDKIQKCFKLNLKDYCAKREVFGKEIGKEYDNIKSKE